MEFNYERAINRDLIAIRNYLHDEILPRYAKFDKGHGIEHIDRAGAKSLLIANEHAVDGGMVQVITYFHDLGREYDYLYGDDENMHHVHSAQILLEDPMLRDWFNEEEMTTMAHAILDHRSSGDREPRSIYGKIMHDADTTLNYYEIIRRYLSYAKKHHGDRLRWGKDNYLNYVLENMSKKCGRNGYLKLYTGFADDAQKLASMHEKIADSYQFQRDIEEAIDEM